MKKKYRTLFAVLFALLGVLMVLQQLDRGAARTGLRAPDVVYGDEESFSEGIVLFLASLLFWQRNPLTWMFAAVLSVGNMAIGILGAVRVLDVWTLRGPAALFWSGVWMFVCIVASWEWHQAHFKLQEKRSLN